MTDHRDPPSVPVSSSDGVWVLDCRRIEPTMTATHCRKGHEYDDLAPAGHRDTDPTDTDSPANADAEADCNSRAAKTDRTPVRVIATPVPAQRHPSYVGACVPFASDVDCRGAEGTARRMSGGSQSLAVTSTVWIRTMTASVANSTRLPQSLSTEEPRDTCKGMESGAPSPRANRRTPAPPVSLLPPECLKVQKTSSR